MKNILQYLEQTAARLPDKTALADEYTEMSFSELISLARRGGSHILKSGLHNKSVVVFADKTPATVAAFFAVICAGCSYVPLEQGMPLHRIRRILEKTEPELIICDDSSAGKASELGYESALIRMDELFSSEPDDAALALVRSQSIDTDPIYIVFTSGSTGAPKGVTGCHRALIDYAEALCPVIGADENSVFGMQVPLYVDACMKELLSVIKCGSTAYLMPQSLFMAPVKCVEYLNRHKINIVCWVASALTLISGLGAFAEVKPAHLRTVCFGSEVFPVKQLRLWQSACPEADFINLYGPTECTGMSFYYRVEREFSEDEPIPVGKPFDNTAYFLLREDDTLAASGEEGEICIRGTCVTLGYYDDPDRTAAAFTQNPLNPHYPEIIYRTGDIGRLNADGELVFVSRKDNQIKNMGYRIELGEIEACANMLDGVESSCCVFLRDKQKLYIYYMGSAGERELQRYLRSELPRYMVPSKYFRMDVLPLLPNGKIDRNKLLDEG